MDKYLEIKNRKYLLKSNYKDDSNLRSSFNMLTEKTFGFNFAKWYEDGYWGDRYIPYSLVHEDKVVSNVSVNIIDFEVLGEKKTFIQIGTVMTDEKYRGQGLSKVLMELVIKEWDDKGDFIYLFANDSVLEFYPKFGFKIFNEYEYSRKITKNNTSRNLRKLDVNNKYDRDLLYKKVCNSVPISKLAMRNNPSLIMFYCTYFMDCSIYYLEDYNSIVIFETSEDTLYVQDVFLDQSFELDEIIDTITNDKTKKVVLGFTPIDSSNYEKNSLDIKDTTLFIRAKKYNPFENEPLMFPVLSQA